MKKDAKTEAIRYWWEKALESLEAARRDLDAESFSFAINRAYYSLFYAVSALLLEEGRRFEKHSGVRAAFNQHFIKTGRLDRKQVIFITGSSATGKKATMSSSQSLTPSMCGRRLKGARSFLGRSGDS